MKQGQPRNGNTIARVGNTDYRDVERKLWIGPNVFDVAMGLLDPWVEEPETALRSDRCAHLVGLRPDPWYRKIFHVVVPK